MNFIANCLMSIALFVLPFFSTVATAEGIGGIICNNQFYNVKGNWRGAPGGGPLCREFGIVPIDGQFGEEDKIPQKWIDFCSASACICFAESENVFRTIGPGYDIWMYFDDDGNLKSAQTDICSNPGSAWPDKDCVRGSYNYDPMPGTYTVEGWDEDGNKIELHGQNDPSNFGDYPKADTHNALERTLMKADVACEGGSYSN